MRLPVIFPLLCYVVALVLAFLLLFAGHKQGFMEDYAVIRVRWLISHSGWQYARDTTS
jgi:general stress protein CsbA